MKDNFLGRWHLDNEPSKEYFGHFVVTETEVTLKLFNCALDTDHAYRIFGTSEHLKDITIPKCYVSNVSSTGDFSTTLLKCHTYLAGKHLTNDHIYNGASIKFHGLNTWVHVDGFVYEDFKFEDSLENFLSIKYKPFPSIPLFSSDSLTLSINYSFGTNHLPLYRKSIAQEAYILINSVSGFNLEQFWESLQAIKGFLTLGYFSEPFISDIKLYSEEDTIEYRIINKWNKMSVDYSSLDFLFTYRHIGANLQELFKKWMEIRLRAIPVVNILIESFSKKNILIENMFLNIIQGIETFHRRLRIKTDKAKSELHKQKISQILENCPPEYKTWLQGKLYFSHEPTLGERLQELFQEIDVELKKVLFPDFESLIKQIKDSRNFYTHYDEHLEKKALKSGELFILAEKLKLLLLILLLKEIGLDNDTVIKIISEGACHLFNHLSYEIE